MVATLDVPIDPDLPQRAYAAAVPDTGRGEDRSVLDRDGIFVFEPHQQGVFDALLTRHADLASMYRAALRIIATEAEAGDRRMRVAMVCHAMREVMNRLGDALGASSSPRISPSVSDQTQALPALLADHPDLVLDRDQELIPVPRKVAAAFDLLIKAAVREKATIRELAAALLTDDANAEHPAVKQWMDVRKYFVKWAHIGAETTDLSDLPSDEELRSKIRVVEDLTEGVTKLFFDARRSVDDLLAEINRTAANPS